MCGGVVCVVCGLEDAVGVGGGDPLFGPGQGGQTVRWGGWVRVGLGKNAVRPSGYRARAQPIPTLTV